MATMDEYCDGDSAPGRYLLRKTSKRPLPTPPPTSSFPERGGGGGRVTNTSKAKQQGDKEEVGNGGHEEWGA